MSLTIYTCWTSIQALEAAAVGGGDRPVEQSDARAIQSAVVRATGHAPIAGGLGATAQSAADLNPRCPTADKTTLSDLLMVSINFTMPVQFHLKCQVYRKYV